MAFFGTITVTQTSDITSFVITDTSNYGSEGTGTFSGRTIGIYKVDGTLLVPLISWPFSSGNIYTVSNALLKDYSLSVVANWLSLSPQPGSTYTETLVSTFLNYTNEFIYGKCQDIAAQPNILNDSQFYSSIEKVQAEVDFATNATAYADQYNAQSAIDRATYLIQNENFFF